MKTDLLQGDFFPSYSDQNTSVETVEPNLLLVLSNTELKREANVLPLSIL